MAEQIFIFKENENKSDPNGTERRFAMLKRNREWIEADYINKKRGDFAYLLIDAQRENFPADLLPMQFVEHCQADKTIPTVIYGGPRWDIYKLLKRFQSLLHRANPKNPKVSSVTEDLSRQPPAGTILVMAISGGKQLAFWPIPN